MHDMHSLSSNTQIVIKKTYLHISGGTISTRTSGTYFYEIFQRPAYEIFGNSCKKCWRRDCNIENTYIYIS